MEIKIVKSVFDESNAVESELWIRRILTKLLIQQLRPDPFYASKLLKASERMYGALGEYSKKVPSIGERESDEQKTTPKENKGLLSRPK